jgi:hypothetical protein
VLFCVASDLAYFWKKPSSVLAVLLKVVDTELVNSVC